MGQSAGQVAGQSAGQTDVQPAAQSGVQPVAGQSASGSEAVWRAGEEVAEGLLPPGSFVAVEIGDALFARIEGRSYKSGCTVPLDELRYLQVLHYDCCGVVRRGEMICNRAIADDLLAIFRTLYEAHYPIERMVLIDDYDADDERSMEANNSSAFNFRFIAGTTRLSNHSRGMAVDINPLYNPYVKRSGERLVVQPEAGRPYVDRTREFPCRIDTADLCYKEFVRRGFEWGGAWRTLKDYQHFEKH